MSTTVSVQESQPKAPSSEKLQRLAVEAGKYLGLDSGDSLPVDEIVAQGKANGYTEDRVWGMLKAEGLASTSQIEIPPQGNLFGELWKPSGGVPSPDDPKTSLSPKVANFREWCEERAAKEKAHTYTRKTAMRRYARAKDVDRYFIKEYDTFSTVLISYDAEMTVDESVAEHSQRFYPRPVRRKRTAILKDLGVLDSYAGVTLRAPKKVDRVPYADSPSGYSHAHTFLWIQGKVSPEDFHPLIERHIKHVDGATEKDHPLDKAVTVNVHVSAEVETPDSVKERGSRLDEVRGDTTGFPHELGNNLPLLNCRFDARGTPSYVEEWCASLRLGTDGELSTRGISRFQRLGVFSEVADSMRWQRRLKIGVEKAKSLAGLLMG